MDKNQLRQLLSRLVAHTHSNKKKSKKNNFDQHRRTKAVFFLPRYRSKNICINIYICLLTHCKRVDRGSSEICSIRLN